jgi:DNA polymerase III epsilon subunit-like protein
VVAEIFFDKELMSSAYFSEKIPQYRKDIKKGKRKVRQIMTIRRILYQVCKKYNISVIMAHNARFDYKSLSLTLRYITKSKFRYFLPYGVSVYDTLKMSRKFFAKNYKYIQYCKKNGFVTKNGKPKFTAEIIYRYIIKDISFVESHTGLEDVLIEKEIFSYLYQRKRFNCGVLYAR